MSPPSCRLVAAALSCALAAAAPARGQANKYVGPGKCYTCHQDKAKPMWEKVHKPSMDQLKKSEAAKFAAALGYGSDTHGARCVECHTTPIAARTGVSCESCHGPGKDYREPHQEAAFYQQADRKGLRDLYKKPEAIAKVCVDCHVTTDKALADAGHPTGRDFDAGAAIAKIAHWPSADQELSRKRDYDAAFYRQVGDAARPLVKGRAPAGGGGGAATAAPVSARPPVSPSRATSVAAAPSADDPLFAEDVPLYPGTAGSTTRSSVAPAPRPAAPPLRSVHRPPPSIVEDRPSGLPEPAVTAVEVAVPASAVPAASAVRAPPPPGDRVLAATTLLERLLQRRAGALDLPAPSPPAEFGGIDGELLRIQDEVLALALEALRKRSP